MGEVADQLRKHVTLHVDALNHADQSTLAHGTVLTVDNQIDITTGTVRVRATFPNTNFTLFPNEFVNARLLVRTLTGVNLLPAAAIQRDNDTTFVYVVDAATETVHTRNIDVATIDGEVAAATGVAPGDTLVVDGFDRLVDGAKVRPTPAPSFGSGAKSAQPAPAPGSARGGTAQKNRRGQNADQPNAQAGPTQPGAQR